MKHREDDHPGQEPRDMKAIAAEIDELLREVERRLARLRE
jgi:hypothetical protein